MKKKPALSSLTKEEYEKRLKKIIIAGLGKAWMFWPPRAEVKRRCKDPKRTGWFVCESCKISHEKIEIDHINPCIKPSEGFVSWDDYITRRFVFRASELQGLCHDCHKAKSKSENKTRKINASIRQQNVELSKIICQHDDSSWCTKDCPKRRK